MVQWPLGPYEHLVLSKSKCMCAVPLGKLSHWAKQSNNYFICTDLCLTLPCLLAWLGKVGQSIEASPCLAERKSLLLGQNKKRKFLLTWVRWLGKVIFLLSTKHKPHQGRQCCSMLSKATKHTTHGVYVLLLEFQVFIELCNHSNITPLPPPGTYYLWQEGNSLTSNNLT
jgi:hypothetical protein